MNARPATADDVRHFYGDDMPYSVRAWVCDVDGEPGGIIGIAMTRPAACLFSAIHENLRPYLKSIAVLRLIKKAQAVMHGLTVPTFAFAEPGEKEAPVILGRLGMEHIDNASEGRLYQWPGRSL